jgi:hypothetical protein
MKLNCHSLDLEDGLITFRIPSEIMFNERFSFGVKCVEVDLCVLTGNAALGTVELGTTPNTQSAKPLCGSCYRRERSCFPVMEDSVLACRSYMQS